MKIKLNQVQADLITALLHNVTLGTNDIYADAAYDLMEQYPEIFGRECGEVPVKVKFPKGFDGDRTIVVKAKKQDAAVNTQEDPGWPFVLRKDRY